MLFLGIEVILVEVFLLDEVVLELLLLVGEGCVIFFNFDELFELLVIFCDLEEIEGEFLVVF